MSMEATLEQPLCQRWPLSRWSGPLSATSACVEASAAAVLSPWPRAPCIATADAAHHASIIRATVRLAYARPRPL